MALKTFDVNIIVPKEATNLVTNPSFEVDTTGYAAGGAGVSIARITTKSRRGIAACEITTAANVESYIGYSITLTAGVTYSISIDVYDDINCRYYFYLGCSAPQSSVDWGGIGYWHRKSWTITADATEAHVIRVARIQINDAARFSVDGFQIEVGAQSTYLDGDMTTGFIVGETAYRWNGLPHASTSWRSGQTRSGGTYVNVASYAKILSIVGLGMAQVTNIAVPSTMGGSFYQNTVPQERAFSIVGNINKAGDYALIEAARSALINAVKPDLVTVKQPLLIQIDQLDANSSPIAETLEVKASYESGLEMDGSGNAYNERVSLNFRQWMPMIQQQGEHGTALGYQTSVANANAFLQRAAGIWSAMGTGAGGSNIIYEIIAGIDGNIYATGNSLNIGGVAAADYVAKWNGTAWSAMQAGFDDVGFSLAAGPDGTIYAGGSFHTAVTGSVTVNHIAKWDGSAWSALATGLDDIVYTIVVGPDGYLYAGGAFHVANTGSVTVNHIAKWNGSAWSALGTGLDDTVLKIVFDKAGNLYAGGSFDVANTGSVTVNNIAKWNGTTWTSLAVGLDGTVNTMAFSANGELYVGGQFHNSTSGVVTDHIAKWNGSAWISLGSGVNGIVYHMAFDKNNMLYAGGDMTTAGGVTLPDSLAMWNGFGWIPVDVNFPGAATIMSIAFDKANNLYVGFDTAGTATSATVTAPNVGSAITYPVITFTGPGSTYQLANYTTGKWITFNLALLAGEVAVLNLDPLHVSFISSFRGSIMNTINPGSNLNWELLPGANNISAFMYGSTSAASGITMTWKDSYWSIDGAVR